MSQFDEEHGLDGPTCAKCGMVNCESVLGCERRVAIKRKSEADYERGIAAGERRERARVVAALKRRAWALPKLVRQEMLTAAERLERGLHAKEGA